MFSKEFFLSTPPYRVAAQAYGDPSLPKVIALHGWLDNSNSFLPLLPYLRGIHLVAIDILGHGHSDHRSEGSVYHFLDAVPHIMDVVDSLGWKEFSILGHSMGGAIATLVAGTFPERLQRLALIEALGPFSREPAEVPAQLIRHIHQAREMHTKRLPVYKSQEDAAKVRKAAGDLSLESTRLLVQRGLKEVEGGFTWRADPRLRLESPLRMSEEQVLAFIRRITRPTLLIEAEKGLKWNDALMENRKREVKNLIHKTLSGGHHLHMDDPEPVAAELNAFLTGS